MIYRGPGFLALPLPLPPPVSNFSLFLSLPMCRRPSLLTEGGGGGVEPNHTTSAWPSVNHSILLGNDSTKQLANVGKAPPATQRKVGLGERDGLLTILFRASLLFCSDCDVPIMSIPEPVFVNLIRSPGIDFQPGGSIRQPYLTYRPARLHRLAESIPWHRFLGSLNVYKLRLRFH